MFTPKQHHSVLTTRTPFGVIHSIDPTTTAGGWGSGGQMDNAPANSHVHPLIAGILNDFMDSHQKLLRAEYVTALSTMDWQYEFSDDNRAYAAGRAKWLRIRELQPIVDDDLSLFKTYRPAVHGAPDIGVAA